MIRRIIYFLLATIVFGGLAGAIAYYAFDFKPKMIATAIGSMARPAETVSAEVARADSWQPQIAGIGTLVAPEGINVAPQVGGVVKEIDFESGQTVKKGQLLIRLDTDTEEAQLRSTLAQLAQASAEFDRNEGLVQKGYATASQLDQLRSQRDSFAATADQLRATIAQKFVYAPWDGKLGLRNVSLGSFLAAGQTIVWLQKTDPIYADFQVTEADYGRIKEGQRVTAQFSAWADQAFTGTVMLTDAKVSDASRMITVRAKIANADGRLLPGMYADVTVDAGTPQQVVTVPNTAVTYTLYGNTVFVVVPAKQIDPKAKDEEKAIEKRFVKTGGVRDGRVEIASGLKPGEQVVTAGQNKIDQGTKVVVNNSIALTAPATTTLE
jgi:RND family efflux transporter MFP subunit